MKKSLHILSSLIFPLTGLSAADFAVSEVMSIDTVWVANQVSFDLHTVGNYQFAAYYDSERMMTVAKRELGSADWEKATLPSRLRWDSHNYVTMGIDSEGYIHVTGNMHVDPLVYYRSRKPYDIKSMERIDNMVGGVDEDSVTYPNFFHSRDGSLLFSYRSGSCGNGNILVNRFDPEEGAWETYLKKPLFEGIEADDDRAAYHHFVKDSDGNFHFAWIWRWTPLVETSHQICYATTPDMKTWYNAFGERIELPFRPDDERVIVDPVPSKGGSHNGRYRVILTKDETPVIAYVKYDEDGLTQLYAAKPEDGKWRSVKISDWDFRWEFTGGGDGMTMGGNFAFTGLTTEGDFKIDWETEKGDSGRYIVDADSLERIKNLEEYPKTYPDAVYSSFSDRPGLSVRLMEGKNPEGTSNTRYLLKWEVGPRKHGRSAPDVIPEGPLSPLLLYELK